MKTIHKHRLDISSKVNTLSLRDGYKVVRCEYLVPEKAVFLWVEVSLDITLPMRERQFRVVRSGEPVPDDFGYLDTALDPFDPRAFHVFEVPEAQSVEAKGAEQGRYGGISAVA
ncbi:MAG: hypothetical protein LAT65_14820 [Saccharospirillum sp.]|nr:hypothetical protein [Saccharospirillum sp.]